jgi:hypothetical protein
VGEWVYRETFIGRGVDARMAIEFLIERLSAEIADDAHGYIGFPPSEEGILSTIRYERAKTFAEAALPEEVEHQLEDCVERWRDFLRGARE